LRQGIQGSLQRIHLLPEGMPVGLPLSMWRGYAPLIVSTEKTNGLGISRVFSLKALDLSHFSFSALCEAFHKAGTLPATVLQYSSSAVPQ